MIQSGLSHIYSRISINNDGAKTVKLSKTSTKRHSKFNKTKICYDLAFLKDIKRAIVPQPASAVCIQSNSVVKSAQQLR